MINTQRYCAVFILMALGSLASGAESDRLPGGIPPLSGKAHARTTDGDDSKSDWTIELTLPEDTWRAIQDVMPKLNWPEPTWKNVRPGIREGTMTLVGDSTPTWFRVVDMNGKELGRDQIIELLKTKHTVLVSASGRMPHSCYLQLPTPGKAIVLLGPGDNHDVAEAKTPAVETAEEKDIDLKDWAEEKSQQYFFNLMQKTASFKIETEEEASEYLQGIWRLDKRAHMGGGHYVRADRGEDVTVICTGKWLVITDLSGADARDMAVARVESVEPDEKGHLQVKTRNSITFDRFQPLDKDHMAVLAYDYIAVVQRVACETPEPKDAGEGAIAPTGLTIVVCDSANNVLDTLVVPGEMEKADFEFTVPKGIDEIRVFAVGNRIVGVGGSGEILHQQLRKEISEGLTKNYFVARSKESGGLGFVAAEIEQGVLNGISAGEAPKPLKLTGEMRKQIREDIAAGKRAPIIYRIETETEFGGRITRVLAD